MRKVLFTATVDSHILNFHIPYLKYFKDNNFEVHVACNGNTNIPLVDVRHNVPFRRSPYQFDNLRAYKNLRQIIIDNQYDLIHCHTPMGGVITRLAARSSRKNGVKVVYTAHGFHFYNGAPIRNWLLYYPIEKWLSRYTDCLITINQEDYQLANEKKFKAGKIKKVNGVGIDLNKFQVQNTAGKSFLRKKYNLPKDDILLIFAGELSYRKHQDMLIKAMDLLKRNNRNISLLLAGEGKADNSYKKLARELKVEDKIEFLGHRKDIQDLLMASDIAVSSSRQEGLPVNVMEAMATGLPLIVTNCRGNRDLVTHRENGFVVELEGISDFVENVQYLMGDTELYDSVKFNNIEKIQKYSIEKVISEYKDIYNSILSSNQK